MKRRKIRFNDGGLNNPFQGDDVDYYSAARDEEGNIAEAKGRNLKAEIAAMQETEKEAAPAPAPAPARAQTFKEAFASARRAGDRTFEWQGKKYTTEMAGAKKPAAPAASAPAPSASRSVSPAPTPSRAEAKSELERESRRGTPPAKGVYDTSRDPLLAKFRKATEEREELARQRKETDAESARIAKRGTPVSRDRDPYMGRTAEQRMKDLRGYAQGGKVTASSRADGIAKRGKTKGKIY